MTHALHANVPQDPLTMAAKRLGEAKTEAMVRGMAMIDSFNHICKEIETLRSHGLSISTVQFEDKAIQAAWRKFNSGDRSELEMPLMETETALVARIRE